VLNMLYHCQYHNSPPAGGRDNSSPLTIILLYVKP
jgi:hypothetical protein